MAEEKTIYESKKKPGTFATVGKIDDVRKTVILVFEDETNQCISISTFKRWWKKTSLTKSEPTEEENQNKETDSAVKKPKKKEAVVPLYPDNFEELLYSITSDLGAGIKKWDKIPNLFAITYNGKSKMEIYKGKKTYRVNVKSKILNDNEDYRKINNYVFDASINYSYTDDMKSILTDMIKRSIEYMPIKAKKGE